MPRVWDTASRGGDVLPGLWHEHRSGIIDTSGQHSRAAVYTRRTDSNAAADSRFADCAGKAPAFPLRYHCGSGHFGGSVLDAVYQLRKQIDTRLERHHFTQYNVGDSLGKVINENMSHAKWSSEKRGNDSYDVTVTGVENMYDSMIEATFRVTYMDDAVHSVLTRASVNGQVCTDSSELAVVMLLLYGQLDEDTLAGLMLWDSIW